MNVGQAQVSHERVVGPVEYIEVFPAYIVHRAQQDHDSTNQRSQSGQEQVKCVWFLK